MPLSEEARKRIADATAKPLDAALTALADAVIEECARVATESFEQGDDPAEVIRSIRALKSGGGQ